MFSGEVSNTSEESSKVEGVNLALVTAVNRPECGSDSVIVADLKIMTENVLLSHEVKFSLNHRRQALLDVNRKPVETANTDIWSIQSHIAKDVVLAWKDHLREVLKG